MHRITVNEAGKKLGVDLSCWPRARIPTSQLLVHPTHDDEGASRLFGDTDWGDVIVQEVEKCPTAQWFLNNESFFAMIPAIAVVVKWIHNTKSDSPLQEHFEVNLDKRAGYLDGLLNKDQKRFLDDVLCSCPSEHSRWVRKTSLEDDLVKPEKEKVSGTDIIERQ